MFRTISSKLILIFILVLIIGFSLTGFTLYYFLGDFMSKEKVLLMKTSGQELSGFLNTYIENQANPLSVLYLSRMLNFYSSSTGSLIFIVNTNGSIVNTGPDISQMPKEVTTILTDASGNLRFPDKSQFESVMNGSELKQIGNFYGLFKNTGFDWITIGLPYKYTQGTSGEKIVGGIFLSTPLPGIEKTRIQVLGFYLISIAISIAVSIILVYLFSLRITRPIKKIRNAAKLIAAGDFEKRLDITVKDEIGDLARTFDNMAVALKNLEEMRRGFIANVSHELRTPITSIKGFIDGILDGTIPSEKQSYYLQIVKDEVERLNRLVNDLLDLARLESGQMKFNITSFNINELIRRSVIKLEHMLMAKNIEIEANFDEEENFTEADLDAVERIILNLLHNALKFSPENGKILISTKTQKNKIIVSVKDFGIGISSDEIDLIWDRFYKSDKSRAHSTGGTGLGLAIIKSLINELGQEIWVESEQGTGSTFSFSLPKAPTKP